MQSKLISLFGQFVASVCVALALTAPAGAKEILNQQTPWRYHASWRTPATIDKDGQIKPGAGHAMASGIRWVRDDFAEPTPGPAGDWMAPDYDDSDWARRQGAVFGGYGYGERESASVEVSLLCVRGRFGVGDPARAHGLKLNLSYRGGAVVYLNGTEVARGHMPPGKIDSGTLAEPYEKEAFCGPDGAMLPPVGFGRAQTPPSNLADRYEKRFRTLSIELPAKLLRKGTNVLAVEVHRAAIPALYLGGKGGGWGTCGVNSILLTAPDDSAAIANTAPPEGVQIWNCSPLVRAGADVKCGDPFEPLRPIALWTPRNGVANGQIVVSGLASPATLSAKISDLKSDKGVVPASAVEVRYVVSSASYPLLLAKPQTATTQPIWLTARPAKEAPAGVYKGTLTITGMDRPAEVPVELTVIDWLCPDRTDFHTSASFLQCPESVAGHYQVPFWSDKHFEHLSKSFEMLGYGGNTLLSIAAISHDLFGDQPAIVFVKQDDTWMPDFRYARRYLQTYDKAAGAPRQLSVQIWNYNISAQPGRRDGGKVKWMLDKLKVWELDGDKLKLVEIPIYTKPGTEKTWEAVAKGMRQIMAELKWDKTALLWGTGGDNLPNDEIVAFFKQIDPKIYWRVATHGGSVSKWGPTPETRTQTGGLIVGYSNLVRRNVTRRPLYDDCPYDVIKRDGVSTPPSEYLSLPPLGRLAAHYSGIGFLPFDFWTYTTREGTQRKPLALYASFGNITPHSPPAFVMPGPDGPAPTPQLEAMREGLQVTEAALYLQWILADEKALAKQRAGFADEVKSTIQAMCDVMESNRRVRPSGTADVRAIMRRVYELAAEVK